MISKEMCIVRNIKEIKLTNFFLLPHIGITIC